MPAKVTGVREMKARLAVMPPNLRARIIEATREGAEEIASMQRRFVPRKTGTLAASIRTEAGQGMGHWVKAGSDEAFYARWVEFGDSDTAANPYFFTSYRALRKRVKSRIARAATKAIKVSVAVGGKN